MGLGVIAVGVAGERTPSNACYQPDPEVAAEFTSVTGLPWACMKCGEVCQRLRAHSATPYRGGALYIAETPQPGVDRNQLKLLCGPCWGAMLQWNARMGYDIHLHAAESVCGELCLVRRNGRKLQFQSLVTIDRTTGFRIIKAIDGRPKVNGASLIWAERLGYFEGGWYGRQAYYESISDPSEVARQLMLNEKLRWSGVPRQSLDAHLVIVEWFESSHKAPNGVVTFPVAGEKSIGYHCIATEEYDADTKTFRFWNSWGSGWGDGAYGTMSLDYLERYHYETFVLRHARWGPSPAKAERMRRAQTDMKALKRLWVVENPRSVELLRGRERNVRFIRYETLSPTTGDPVTCLEVTTGFGLRMGWIFLRHHPGENKYTEITEVFVWPIFRRLHLGQTLEAAGVDEAQYFGSRDIRLIMNEADAVIGPPRSTARNFAKACGYSLRWRTSVAPRAHATGIKAIDH